MARRSAIRKRSISAISVGTLPSRTGEHVLHVADHDVLGQRAVAQTAHNGSRRASERARDLQLLSNRPQAGGGDLGAQPPQPNPLQQVIVLVLAAPGRLDEGVLV